MVKILAKYADSIHFALFRFTAEIYTLTIPVQSYKEWLYPIGLVCRDAEESPLISYYVMQPFA